MEKGTPKGLPRQSRSQKRWYLVQRAISPLMVKGRYDVAHEVVNSFLRSRPSQSTRGEALGMRSSFWEYFGDLPRAKRDALASCRLRQPRSYGKYVSQLCLGAICQKMGQAEEAIQWYRVGLKTCAATNDISCSAVLRRWLALCPEKRLSRSDRALCRKAARKAWKALRLSGEPRPKDLAKLAERLRKREGRPPVRPRKRRRRKTSS